MKSVLKCVVCDGTITLAKAARATPFLARRIWNRDSFAVQLSRCLECGFLFYNPRLEELEEQKLYREYREHEYQQMRYSLEPWYTKQFNENLSSPELMRIRKTCVSSIFRQHVAGHQIRSILDFGGDRGDLVDHLVPNAEGYVYDISGVEPLPGITKCRNLEECRRQSFDLVICSNVLEHVGFPQAVLGQLRDVCAADTLVFLEVPWESPLDGTAIAKRLAQQAILMIRRPRLGLSLLGPGFMYQMHEHVNFFGPKSITRLVSSNGWQVVASGAYDGPGYKFGPYKMLGGRMVWCLARVGRKD